MVIQRIIIMIAIVNSSSSGGGSSDVNQEGLYSNTGHWR